MYTHIHKNIFNLKRQLFFLDCNRNHHVSRFARILVPYERRLVIRSNAPGDRLKCGGDSERGGAQRCRVGDAFVNAKRELVCWGRLGDCNYWMKRLLLGGTCLLVSVCGFSIAFARHWNIEHYIKCRVLEKLQPHPVGTHHSADTPCDEKYQQTDRNKLLDRLEKYNYENARHGISLRTVRSGFIPFDICRKGNSWNL